MPQALGRWEAQPGAAQSSAGNAAEVVPSAAAAAGLNEPGQGYQAQLMQRAHSAQANRCFGAECTQSTVCILHMAGDCIALGLISGVKS